MEEPHNQSPVTIQELLVSSLARTDALAQLLVEKGAGDIGSGLHE
jgi:hypothetical protein